MPNPDVVDCGVVAASIFWACLVCDARRSEIVGMAARKRGAGRPLVCRGGLAPLRWWLVGEPAEGADHHRDSHRSGCLVAFGG